MTSITDTLKQALEALEGADQIDCDMQAAITAIKEVLAQPEQETTSGLHTCPYAEEIHGDYVTLCDCDEERTRQCAQDI